MLRFHSDDARRDVVITGAGCVSPLGNSLDSTWAALLRGECAGRALTSSDIDHFTELKSMRGLRVHGAAPQSAGWSKSATDSLATCPANDQAHSAWLAEPLISMALASFHEALKQSGLNCNHLKSDRTAIVYGSSKGGMRSAERVAAVNAHTTADRQSASVHSFAANAVTRALALVTGARGAVSCPVAACATGLVAMLQGAARIHSGECDVCIVGSSDAALRASVLASFHRLGVTSRHSDAATACRPFDASRDGFIVGEGAGTLILESREHAESRGACGLARVVSGGWLTDPTGLTQIDDSGAIVAELLKRCVAPEMQIDAISVHGTGTITNDLAEARGISRHFDGRTSIPCFGIKGAIGHLLGAAGSVEAAVAVKCLRAGMIPGTTNLVDRDEDCPIRTSSQPIVIPDLRTIVKLSLGFGGHVAAAVIERR